MMAGAYDLVIRHGTVLDGSGGEPFVADVAVVGDTIAAIGVGHDLGPGNTEIDAAGLLVTPGFIDAHSHLDGAVTWEHRLAPNSGHGITTTVMGNCGVGFAPCRAEHRGFTMDLMEGVEDIPRSLLEMGLPWQWQSYPEYRRFLSPRRFDMNVAGLLPHSSLRYDVMGPRSITGEPATAEDLAVMAEQTREALASGAVGVGSTRILGQKTRDGRPSPSRFATEDEYAALAGAIAEHGRGVLQIAPEFNQFPTALDELAMIIRVARTFGITVTYSLKQTNRYPQGWRQLLELTAAANADGVDIHPQVLARPTGAVIGWETSRHRFSRCPTYRSVEDLPLPARVTELARPAVRERILAEARADEDRFAPSIHLLFPVDGRPDYEPEPANSVAARAAADDAEPAALIYDCYMARHGHGLVLSTSGNYAEGNLDFAMEMLQFDTAIPGLGDAGAHSSVICDASATTSTLSYWTRDRVRGGRLGVPFVVKRLTADIADVFGLHGRGRVEVGAKADLNVIDYDRLSLQPPRMTYDLPGGGRRLVQDAEGYVATVVNGVLVARHDQPTDHLPGILI